MGYVDSAGKSEIAQNGAIELRGGRGKCLSHLQKALRHDLRTGKNRGMVGLGGLEPPTSPLSGARSSHLSYRPQHRRGNFHNYLIVRWFSVFRNCAEICASVQDSSFPGPLTVHDLLNQSSVYRGGFSPRSVKMYWLSQEVQCFRVDPINKQATMGAARR